MSTQTSDRSHLTAPLVIGAVGVVYGDVGTSPLYTMREAFHGPHAIASAPENVLGFLSLVLWSFIVVIVLKYMVLIMRADNRGEGGIMALTALVSQALNEKKPKRRAVLIALGIFGAGMFYGDGMITPAVSVLSAVEGLGVIAPSLQGYVVPAALLILIALFAIQRYGTARVGALFGPVMCLWFIVLAVLGILEIVRHPVVLKAVNPHYAFQFLTVKPSVAFVSLGALILALTGTEAMYMDMGHFGKVPIRRAWIFLVMPALLLNYFGQGALLLNDAATARNPFYLLAPAWGLPLLVMLATCAAVIASQAVISGVFSLTRQAVQMGYCPRVDIEHTSEREIGQIYVSFANWTLLIAVILLILQFRSSSNLAGAYGIAVTTAMLIDSLLIFAIMVALWKWPLWRALLIAVPLVCIDMAFLASNAVKIPDGGWFPLAVGVAVFTMLTTWKRGRAILRERLLQRSLSLDVFIQSLYHTPPERVPGTAVFLTASSGHVPVALLHNLKHNKVLHERVYFLTLHTLKIPYNDVSMRLKITALHENCHQIDAYYGFKDDIDVPALLNQAEALGHRFDMMETSFFVSRETLIASPVRGMMLWREKLFVWMSKNAVKATDFYKIPTNRVVELGAQIEL